MTEIARWVKNLIKIIRNYGRYELYDLSEGQARIKPGESVTLYDSKKAGELGGFINFNNIGGPNEASLRIELYTEAPGDARKVQPYIYRQATITRSAQTPFSPIIDIDAVYAPFGGRVVLEQTNGLSTAYYYYIYRR